MVALVEMSARVDQSMIEIAPFGREAVAHPFGKTCDFLGKRLELRVAGVQPSPDRDAEPRIVPPFGVKARSRGDDPLALIECRRQRPIPERKM